MISLTRTELATFLRPVLAWGPRTSDELLRHAFVAGAPLPVTEALKRLPAQKYATVDQVCRDLPDLVES
ncbi:DUF2795 domain-containing protein [Georgenia daeguensis]|uniref:DUF2795 domain-containing protein n=1 Tax=Georgenia daeguensis TaxID=908355 RepID=A0ABP8EYL0_9MICO